MGVELSIGSGALPCLTCEGARICSQIMVERTVQLVLQYDGAGFAGWQRQPRERTVQAVVEGGLARLCGRRVVVGGAGHRAGGREGRLAVSRGGWR